MAMIVNQTSQISKNDKNIVTIQDLIDRKQIKGKIDYNTYSFSISLKDTITLPFQNVLTTTYAKELKELAIDIKLTNDEYYKYRYRPKLLAYDIYNYSELFYIINFINGIYNIKDFNFKTLKLIPKTDLFNLLSYVLQADSANISDFNNSHVE